MFSEMMKKIDSPAVLDLFVANIESFCVFVLCFRSISFSLFSSFFGLRYDTLVGRGLWLGCFYHFLFGIWMKSMDFYNKNKI